MEIVHNLCIDCTHIAKSNNYT